MSASAPAVPVAVVAREWARIGVTGFGGPPAHILLLRRLVVERHGWMDAAEFEDANAACGLLPGPASTQLAIFTAYRVGGRRGAVVGGLGFVLPAVVLVTLLATLFLSGAPPHWVSGAGAGAGAAVAAVAVQAGLAIIGPSLARTRRRARWTLYVLAGAAAAALAGPYLVLVLLAAGALEWLASGGRSRSLTSVDVTLPAIVLAAASTGGAFALAWTAFKVGALSYGGGFVIIPLMQHDAVDVHHWLTDRQFLDAVAIGQVTPGPVVATVAAVGYAASGVHGALLAAAVAFAPSFSFVLLGGGRFERLREAPGARAFLDGAGPAAAGAILGSAVTLARALTEPWQAAVLAGAALALLVVRRGAVETLVAAGAAGTLVALLGGPVG